MHQRACQGSGRTSFGARGRFARRRAQAGQGNTPGDGKNSARGSGKQRISTAGTGARHVGIQPAFGRRRTSPSTHPMTESALRKVREVVWEPDDVRPPSGSVATSAAPPRSRSSPRTDRRIVARRGRNIVVLQMAEVWAFEACGRHYFVHSMHGRFGVDLSLLDLEGLLGPAFLRVHRNWLAKLAGIRAYEGKGREHELRIGMGFGTHDRFIRVPVARDLARAVRARLIEGCVGIHVNTSRRPSASRLPETPGSAPIGSHTR